MKRFLAMICVLSIVLSLGILPASAAAGDSMVLRFVSLRTTEGKEGIYFGANFTLTQETIDAMGANGCYGIALTPYKLDDDAAWAANMGSKVQASKYTGGLTAGNTTYVRSTSLVNILNFSNENVVNNRNASTVIYVKPYVKDNNGNYTFGEAGQVSMKQVAQLIDLDYSNLNDVQKKGLLGMYERFANVMKGWGLTNLKNHYASGGYNAEGKSLILEYRREKVVANMQAQADILWSFDGTDPIQYSRRPTSNGLDADIASYPSDVYTIYPGRVYKGIPYTHGSAGLDVYYTMGAQNGNGVWVLEGLNSSVLNGGANANAYNMSRMGNDCWDAISWAYETIGSSVSADQTNEVTPDFGMYPVGPYAEDLFSLFLTEPASDGKVRLTTFGDVYTNYFENNAENRQTIYESYAKMQQGDTMVHYVSGAGGHALMAISVNVVRNNDGSINPDQSKVTYIEQGSGHEKAQSTYFDVENLYTQTWAHAGGHNNQGFIQNPGEPEKCLDCAKEAGYNAETGIWTLNPGKTTDTFTTLFDDGGYYIPMTSEELRNPTAKIPTSRISDSVNNTANVANIYTGKLDSTYRVSQITLDVFNNAGQNVNSVTCFGIQSGLTAAFNLNRFISDQNIDATSPYGSVLHGTPAIAKKSVTLPVLDAEGNETYTYTEAAEGAYYQDAEGNYVEITDPSTLPENTVRYDKVPATKTYTWMETTTLTEGFYSFTLTCKLANGYTRTFRIGYFQVAEGTTPEGNPALLVTAE